MKTTSKKELGSEELLQGIRQILNYARNQVVRTVNTVILFTYWNIGKVIVERQGGENRAQYGNHLLEEISEHMVIEFGKGFSKRYLEIMRKFYLSFSIAKSMISQLT